MVSPLPDSSSTLSFARVSEALLGAADATTREREALRLLWVFASEELDREGHFAAPVEAEGYSLVVRRPMDLSVMKVKLDRGKYSLDSFMSDVAAIAHNCLAFNEEGSHVCHCAQRLLKGCEQACRNIRAVLDNDPSLAVEAAEQQVELVVAAVTVPSSSASAASAAAAGEGLTAMNVVHTAEAAPAASIPAAADAQSVPEGVPAVIATDELRLVISSAKPDLVATLRSSRLAAEALRARSDHEVPEVVADGQLAWVLAMARDRALQALLVALLARRLVELASNALRRHELESLDSDPAASSALLVPSDDAVLRAVLQMCQLGFLPVGRSLLPVSSSMLRLLLPCVLREVLSADSSGTESSEQVAARSIAACSAYGSVTPKEAAFLGQLIAQLVKLRSKR